VQAWTDLGILEWLVEVGVEVRDVLDRRQGFDVSPAEYSDAVARVEQRRSDVIRARRAVRFASDRLKQLMNDRDIALAGEVVLFPANELFDQPITYNLREAILTAIDQRPEIDRAALAVTDSDIRIALADNDRLPFLDLSAQAAFLGLDDSAEESYKETGDGRFIDYVLGLAFQYPLGNRAAEAGFRRSRLERSAAIIGYQRAVQEVVLDVKNALRDVLTNYELIGATRSFRVAQAENLRALQVEEETLAGLTPEFLNLKFQQQERLASARRQEIDAVTSFDKAVSSLYRAMGTGLSVKNIEVEVEEANPALDAGIWGPDVTQWPKR
jgi:outer membrane protein TolC